MTLQKMGFFITTIWLTACSIISAPSPNYNGAITAEIKTPAPSPSPSPDIAATERLTPQPPPTINFENKEINCSVYIETRWGAGDGDGDEDGVSHTIAFDETGNMFIADRPNRQILRYPKGIKIPEEIKINDSYTLPYGSVTFPWFGMDVSESKIYFMFLARSGNRTVQKVAILSLQGLEESVIDLEPYYPLDSHLGPSLMVDRYGGVYVFITPVGIVHYSSQLQPEFIHLGVSFPYEELIVGWDRILYSYDNSSDRLTNWGPSNRPSIIHGESFSNIRGIKASSSHTRSLSLRFEGVDDQGHFYFSSYWWKDSPLLLRVNPSTMEGEIGEVQNPWMKQNIQFALSPDGALYGLTHDWDDSSIQPKIVRCSFE